MRCLFYMFLAVIMTGCTTIQVRKTLNDVETYIAEHPDSALVVYFLMIESALIDGYGHNNDSEGMIAEMKEFDALLRQLVAYVDQNPETLLVVTADHETGGTWLTYTGYEVGGSSPITMSYSSRGHSGVVVPIFAYGEGAESFAGVMKNTDIPKKIESLMTGQTGR